MKKIIGGILLGFLFLLPSSLIKAQTSSHDLQADASIKANLSGLRAQAELFYDNTNYSYKNLCKDSRVKDILSEIKDASGKKIKCNSNKDNYAISSPLKSDSSIQYCVDSTGFAGNGTVVSKNKTNTCKSQVLTSNKNNDVTKVDHFISGNINSQVKFVTYSSLEDPFSRQFDKTIRLLSKDYGNQVAFVFRHNPLDMLFKDANLAANAAECISKIGKEDYFSPYVSEIFKAQDEIENFEITKNTLSDLALDFGVNKNKFNSCLAKSRYDSKIKSDLKKIEGTELANGVPYSVVYGSKNSEQIIAGAQSYEEVRRIIDSMLIK